MYVINIFTYRGVSRIFFFIRDRIVARELEKNVCTSWNNCCPWGITDKRAEYLILTKERLVLTSALNALKRAFFIRRKNILFRISSGAYLGDGGTCPPHDFIYQGGITTLVTTNFKISLYIWAVEPHSMINFM